MTHTDKIIAEIAAECKRPIDDRTLGCPLWGGFPQSRHDLIRVAVLLIAKIEQMDNPKEATATMLMTGGPNIPLYLPEEHTNVSE